MTTIADKVKQQQKLNEIKERERIESIRNKIDESLKHIEDACQSIIDEMPETRRRASKLLSDKRAKDKFLNEVNQYLTQELTEHAIVPYTCAIYTKVTLSELIPEGVEINKPNFNLNKYLFSAKQERLLKTIEPSFRNLVRNYRELNNKYYFAEQLSNQKHPNITFCLYNGKMFFKQTNDTVLEFNFENDSKTSLDYLTTATKWGELIIDFSKETLNMRLSSDAQTAFKKHLEQEGLQIKPVKINIKYQHNSCSPDEYSKEGCLIALKETNLDQIKSIQCLYRSKKDYYGEQRNELYYSLDNKNYSYCELPMDKLYI